MSANENIEKQKIKLPEAKAPVGNYVATKISGKMLFISGQISIDENGKSCVKLTGFVNSTDDFTEQPKVINGASDLIASVFGDAGMHTRAAVSTNSLPLGVSVEVDAIFELN